MRSLRCTLNKRVVLGFDWMEKYIPVFIKHIVLVLKHIYSIMSIVLCRLLLYTSDNLKVYMLQIQLPAVISVFFFGVVRSSFPTCHIPF